LQESVGLLEEWRIEISLPTRDFALVIERRWQIAGLVAAFAGAAMMCCLAAGDLAYRRVAAGRTTELRHAESASAELRRRAAQLHERLVAAAQQNLTAQHQVAALEQQEDTARRGLAAAEARLGVARNRALAPQLAQAVDRAERHEAAAEDARAGLAHRLDKAEADVADAAARANRLRSALDGIEEQLRAAARARDRARSEREAAFGRLQQLENGVAATASGAWGKVEHVLAKVGLNADRFFARFGLKTAPPDEGGPFFPPRPPQAMRLKAFHALLASLPLTLPLREYRMTSAFGMRSDPFNHRPAFHPGIDLAAPYMTPVYATAAGTVSYAGWESGYGKLVDVDHGNGIMTRYAHLHRYTVSVGERVVAGTQVGLLGSSGRSTGPHVLYEVDVNGKPRDPEAFLALGREVASAAARR
jgi:murein DD-endopeptidase MepM/ murein hydrolase activator NlpD